MQELRFHDTDADTTLIVRTPPTYTSDIELTFKAEDQMLSTTTNITNVKDQLILDINDSRDALVAQINSTGIMKTHKLTTFQGILDPAILGNAYFGGTITDFRDAAPETTEVRVSYKEVTATTWTSTPWIPKSDLGLYNVTVTGIESSVDYHVRAEARDTDRGSLGISLGNVVTVLGIANGNDIDSIINITGVTDTGSSIALNSINATVVDDSGVINPGNFAASPFAESGKLDTRTFEQQSGQNDFTRVNPSITIYPRELRVTPISGATNTINVISEIPAGIVNVGGVIVGSDVNGSVELTVTDVTPTTNTLVSALDQYWTSNSISTLYPSVSVRKIDYIGDSGLYFASAYKSGVGAVILVSEDAINWDYTTVPGAMYGAESVAYGNGIYVAVGGNFIAVSYDGYTWSNVSAVNNVTETLYSVAYGDNAFVAVGAGGALYTSGDATTWTKRTTSFGSNAIFTVQYDGSKYIAGGVNGNIGTSVDGLTWNQQVSNFNGYSVRDIIKGGVSYVAVGDYGTIAYSTDGGVTWTNAGDVIGTTSGDRINGVAYSPDSQTFLAVAGGGRFIESSDGMNWVLTTIADSNSNLDIVYGYTAFKVVNGGGGINTHLIQATTYAITLEEEITADYDHYIVGGQAIKCSYSTDGSNYTTDTVPTLPKLHGVAPSHYYTVEATGDLNIAGRYVKLNIILKPGDVLTKIYSELFV